MSGGALAAAPARSTLRHVDRGGEAMRNWIRAAAFGAAVAAAPGGAWAVFSGDMSPRARSGDSDYADGVEAWERKDWPAAVVALEKVVARRPWHDNAHSLLGYSLRKLGDYEKALEHYHTALDLNPRHRQALEYMGRAYLEMHWPDKAEETLERLGGVCRFVALTFSDGDFTDGCDEYRSLSAAVAHYRETGYPPEE
jgi:tetratricopeptide (TPR) repeat protein